VNSGGFFKKLYLLRFLIRPLWGQIKKLRAPLAGGQKRGGHFPRMRGNSIMPLALINRQAEGAQGAASGAKERSSRCTYRLRPPGACSWLGRRTATGGPHVSGQLGAAWRSVLTRFACRASWVAAPSLRSVTPPQATSPSKSELRSDRFLDVEKQRQEQGASAPKMASRWRGFFTT